MDLLERIISAQESSYGSIVTRNRFQWPTRQGEYYGLCPYHGDRKPGSFSFSERGFNCFACGEHGSLRKLALQLGIIETSEPIPFKRPAPRPEPPSKVKRWQNLDPLKAFRPIPPNGWDVYRRRGIKPETIDRWHLGYGVLPNCRCKLPRLILPIYAHGQLVGIRGRMIEQHHPCDLEAGPCPKWLPSYGSDTVLFGAELLKRDAVVIITEGPFDAILAMQEEPGIIAVAGTSGQNWEHPGWTHLIRDSRPKLVIVWLDNEVTGCPNAETYAAAEKRLRRAYKGSHYHPPEPMGVRIANQLLEAGVPTQIYQWPTGTPEKADLADVAVGA